MQKLLIIPARSGSKRIPNKNFKDFLGKPLISYVINSAIESRLFDEVMVSTNSKVYAKTAQKLGAQVPFLRSDKNSDDFATTADVLREVIDSYKRISKEFDTICCIYPTAVLLKMASVEIGFEKLIKNKFDSVLSVKKYSHPIERALVTENGKIRFFDSNQTNIRTQDLIDKYYDAGQFYWLKTNQFLETGKIISPNSSFVLLEDFEAQDIDEPDQWKLAEMKYRFLQFIERNANNLNVKETYDGVL